MSKKLDLTGQKFGRLKVIKEDGKNKHGHILWLCICDCSNETIVPTNSLRSGNTQSCGCLQQEVMKVSGRKNKGNSVNNGSDNGMWKGDDAGYDAIHLWVRRHKPKPRFCECCNELPPMDLANISGEYKRDIDDYEYLCRKCHMTKDGRLEKLHNIKNMIDGSVYIWQCTVCNTEIISQQKPYKCGKCKSVDKFILLNKLITNKIFGEI